MKIISQTLCILLFPLAVFAGETHSHSGVPTPPILALVPFFLLLAAIAIIPLLYPIFWEHNSNKAWVTGIISVPIIIYYLEVDPIEIIAHLEEYFGFICLLWSLYTISGGIVLRGNLLATPRTNTIFLAIGSVIANIFGTTGAAMLLIRPMLRTNMERRHKTHIFIFFTFLVCNVGGCLTPLGDPPLYMGYLKGIPFTWTFRLLPEWLFVNSILLLMFYIWDRKAYAKETPKDKKYDEADFQGIRIDGMRNIPLILGVLLVIAFGVSTPYREGIMLFLGILSMVITPKRYREANYFSFHAIIEVAVLFVGIFITMIPALIFLEHKGADIGVTAPWQYFWACGLLSSVLDNTPTYLTFFSLAQGALGLEKALSLVDHASGDMILRGISLGAVYMGAMTYIGNGPNFMVKAICEQKGPLYVNMPSFGGYVVYSFILLIPICVLVSIIFLV